MDIIPEILPEPKIKKQIMKEKKSKKNNERKKKYLDGFYNDSFIQSYFSELKK